MITNSLLMNTIHNWPIDQLASHQITKFFWIPTGPWSLPSRISKKKKRLPVFPPKAKAQIENPSRKSGHLFSRRKFWIPIQSHAKRSSVRRIESPIASRPISAQSQPRGTQAGPHPVGRKKKKKNRSIRAPPPPTASPIEGESSNLVPFPSLKIHGRKRRIPFPSFDPTVVDFDVPFAPSAPLVLAFDFLVFSFVRRSVGELILPDTDLLRPVEDRVGARFDSLRSLRALLLGWSKVVSLVGCCCSASFSLFLFHSGFGWICLRFGFVFVVDSGGLVNGFPILSLGFALVSSSLLGCLREYRCGFSSIATTFTCLTRSISLLIWWFVGGECAKHLINTVFPFWVRSLEDFVEPGQLFCSSSSCVFRMFWLRISMGFFCLS